MQLQTGDILFVDSGTCMGSMIKKFTNFKYSHVALVLSKDTIVEVTAFKKSKLINIADLEYECFAVARPRAALTPQQRLSMVTHATVLLGKPYDYLAASLMVFRTMFGLRKTIERKNLNKIYCTELIDYVYECTSIDLVEGVDSNQVSIEELYRSDKLYIEGYVSK